MAVNKIEIALKECTKKSNGIHANFVEDYEHRSNHNRNTKRKKSW